MEIEFDLADLKEAAVRRMLREALSREKQRSLPLHKRDKKSVEVEVEDEATEEADEENAKLADLAAEHGEPKEIPMTDEDISEEAGEKLKPPKKAGKKLGKPYTPS